MDTAHFKKLLLAKQRELQSSLATLEREASDPADDEVGDYTDSATGEQGSSGALDVATMLSRTLQNVEDALQRIEDGSYGKCVRCGKDIEPARLEAVPWTPYCLADQEKLDGEVRTSATL